MKLLVINPDTTETRARRSGDADVASRGRPLPFVMGRCGEPGFLVPREVLDRAVVLRDVATSRHQTS